MTHDEERKRPGAPRLVGTGVLVAAASASLWWLCRGENPKEMAPAQVGACMTGLAVVGALGAAVLPTPLLVLCVAAPFTVAWSLTASADDDTGLWGVGALLVALGTSAGSALVATVTKTVRTRRRKPVR